METPKPCRKLHEAHSYCSNGKATCCPKCFLCNCSSMPATASGGFSGGWGNQGTSKGQESTLGRRANERPTRMQSVWPREMVRLFLKVLPLSLCTQKQCFIPPKESSYPVSPPATYPNFFLPCELPVSFVKKCSMKLTGRNSEIYSHMAEYWKVSTEAYFCHLLYRAFNQLLVEQVIYSTPFS